MIMRDLHHTLGVYSDYNAKTTRAKIAGKSHK